MKRAEARALAAIELRRTALNLSESSLPLDPPADRDTIMANVSLCGISGG